MKKFIAILAILVALCLAAAGCAAPAAEEAAAPAGEEPPVEEAAPAEEAAEQVELDKEKRLQQAVLNIKKSMGANAILKGMNLEEGATGKARNEQIGGHRK